MHGYLSSSNCFVYQIPFFQRDFDVYAPDFKGFGNNKGMPKAYSLDDYVDDLVRYLDDRKIIKPSVVAHSFGARVALKATYRYPDIFGKIVLTGAAGMTPKKTVKKVAKKATYKLLKNFLPKEKLKVFYSSDYLALDGVMRESFVKIVSERLEYTLSSVKNPTLLIFGKDDKDTPLYMARRMHRGIINSKLLVFEKAGHFCFLDKPLKFNTEVKEFLLSNE